MLQGSAEQYAGTNPDFSLAVKYFGPSLASADHLFSELDREQGTSHELPRGIGQGGHDDRRRSSEQLTDLIGNANTTFQAVGSQQANLAQGLHELPVALRQGNRTFAELPPTLGALTTARERVQARPRRNSRCSSRG